MNTDRIDGSRLRERHDLEVMAPRPRDPARTDSQRAADRMSELIANGEYGHGTPHFADATAPAVVPCVYTDEKVKRCSVETISGAELFVKGARDVDAVDANDIAQGRIGDCHLLGPAMALAQSPAGRQRIREMIKEVQRDGKTVYEVTFQVPVDRTARQWLKGDPAYKAATVEVPATFIRGHAGTGDVEGGKQEIWPLVLEAGYAKLRGGYPGIENGRTDRAFEAITGKPAQARILGAWLPSYSVSDLKKDAAAGKPICLCFVGDQKKDETAGPAMKKLGLHEAHSYTLGPIFEHDGVTYVHLRNPWGPAHDPKAIPLRDLEALGPRIDIGQLP